MYYRFKDSLCCGKSNKKGWLFYESMRSADPGPVPEHCITACVQLLPNERSGV